MAEQKLKVVVIGGGLMGTGMAAMSALAGNETILVTHRESSIPGALATAKEFAAFRIENELGYETADYDALISATADLPKALEGADLVFEAINEVLSAKQVLFKEVEKYVRPDIPVCSNTSALPITEICEGMEHPERAFTTHFWFPAYLTPLVEIIMHEGADLTMAEWIKAELTRWRKTPVILKKDIPGQLGNRLQHAMMREALYMVENDIVSPEDVDIALENSFGARLGGWGLFKHMDAVGLELIKATQKTIIPYLADNKEPAAILDRKMEEGCSGFASGKGFYDWSEKSMEKQKALRDRTIIAVLRARMEE